MSQDIKGFRRINDFDMISSYQVEAYIKTFFIKESIFYLFTLCAYSPNYAMHAQYRMLDAILRIHLEITLVCTS